MTNALPRCVSPVEEHNVRFAAPLLIAMTILLAAQHRAAAWVTFRGESGFRMEVPNEPAVFVTEHPSLLGAVTSCQYTARDGDSIFVASVSTLPRWMVRIAGSEVILRRAVQAFLTDAEGQAEEVERSDLAAHAIALVWRER